MRRNRKTYSFFLFVMALFVIALIKIAPLTMKDPSNEKNTLKNENTASYCVIEVVDGDTIKIDYQGTEEKVRLIGIDTPESVHPNPEKNVPYGKVATEYTKAFIGENDVYLEFDVQERDQYGRLLAYVFVNDTMLNKALVEHGHAKAATFPPNVAYENDFVELERKAREEKIGLWSEEYDE